MTKMKEFNMLDNEFIEKANGFAEDEPYQLFFLFNAMNMILYESKNFNDVFILERDECQAIGLSIDDTYYLYCKNWTEVDLEIIRKRIFSKTFPVGFHFAGTHDFINKIFEKVELRTADFKNRIFYKITSEPKIELNIFHLISEPSLSDVNVLAKLYQQYFEEEYKGIINKDIVVTTSAIRDYISSSDIYVNKKDGAITGFCTTIYSKTDQPIIGTFYVDKKYRNNGIGRNLINYVTRKLLTTAKVCYLMTERENIESNRVMESIGYLKIYEHTDKIITAANSNNKEKQL